MSMSVEEKIAELRERIARLEAKIDDLNEEMHELREQYNKIFRTIVYGILLLLASIVASNSEVLKMLMELMK